MEITSGQPLKKNPIWVMCAAALVAAGLIRNGELSTKAIVRADQLDLFKAMLRASAWSASGDARDSRCRKSSPNALDSGSMTDRAGHTARWAIVHRPRKRRYRHGRPPVPLRSTYGQPWRRKRFCTNKPHGPLSGGRSPPTEMALLVLLSIGVAFAMPEDVSTEPQNCKKVPHVPQRQSRRAVHNHRGNGAGRSKAAWAVFGRLAQLHAVTT